MGDIVEIGSPLGKVVGMTDEESHIIISEKTGMVIMLRTFPRVLTGESVGVVMSSED